MKKLFGICATFPECFKQEADVVYVYHVLFGRTSAVWIQIAYAGGEKDVVQRFGYLLGTGYAPKFVYRFGVVCLLHGSVLLSVWFDFGKRYGKLAFVALDAQFLSAVFKPCLYFLHAEKLAAHVPLTFPVAERLWIIAYQTVKRVYGLSEGLAVVCAAYPLFATQTEQAAVVHYQFAIGDAHKKRINLNAETCVKPLGETHRNTVIGTPCSLFILRGVSLSDDYQALRSELQICTLVGSELRISSSLKKFFCKDMKILLCFFKSQPVYRLFPKRFRHFGKVYPTVFALAFDSQFFAVHLDEFNQILIGVHNYKNCDIKEKPSVGVNSTYAGRMQPIVSARPP